MSWLIGVRASSLVIGSAIARTVTLRGTACPANFDGIEMDGEHRRFLPGVGCRVVDKGSRSDDMSGDLRSAGDDLAICQMNNLGRLCRERITCM